MSALFTPFTLKDVTLRNRIAVPPMCQYMAQDGFTNDWHQVHYAAIARGGPGLVIVEATAVSPEGRITPDCLGLWDDAQVEGLARIAAAIKAGGATPGIQIGHAGRKASANRPWDGDDHIAVGDPRGWGTLSPSARPFSDTLPRVPQEMSLADIERVRTDFAAAARRARAAGFEWLELHFAHGYLAQSFFSVHANHRKDAYGGDLAGRSRFLLETLEAVRSQWPENLPLTARFGVLEYDGRDEKTLEEAIEVVRGLKDRGLDFLSVSMGFSTTEAQIPWSTPGFMGPISKQVREATGLPVGSAWGFHTPELADRAVAEGQLDVAMVGRAFLANPHWAHQAAVALGEAQAPWVLPASYAHWLERYRPVA